MEPFKMTSRVKDEIEKDLKMKTGYNKDYECIVISVLKIIKYVPIRV